MKTALTIALLALPLPAVAGGLAPGGPPDGWGAPSVSQGQGFEQDGIRNYEGCSGNKALCPRRGSDWWDARERQRELLRPTPKPDPVEEIARPGKGVPETPGETPTTGTPGGGGNPAPSPEVPAVPLPAAVWLMLAGLGGIGAIKVRRRTA